jgi:hypothetical protein
MEAEILCPIDRCFQGPPVVCSAAQIIEKGQIEVIGTQANGTAALVVIAAEAADGTTQRAVDAAAGKLPRADRYAPLYSAEEVRVKKMPGDDAIAAGTKLWFSVADNVAVSALVNASHDGKCYPCLMSLEASNDTTDTIVCAFNGVNSVCALGTAQS